MSELDSVSDDGQAGHGEVEEDDAHTAMMSPLPPSRAVSATERLRKASIRLGQNLFGGGGASTPPSNGGAAAKHGGRGEEVRAEPSPPTFSRRPSVEALKTISHVKENIERFGRQGSSEPPHVPQQVEEPLGSGGALTNGGASIAHDNAQAAPKLSAPDTSSPPTFTPKFAPARSLADASPANRKRSGVGLSQADPTPGMVATISARKRSVGERVRARQSHRDA